MPAPEDYRDNGRGTPDLKVQMFISKAQMSKFLVFMLTNPSLASKEKFESFQSFTMCHQSLECPQKTKKLTCIISICFEWCRRQIRRGRAFRRTTWIAINFDASLFLYNHLQSLYSLHNPFTTATQTKIRAEHLTVSTLVCSLQPA